MFSHESDGSLEGPVLHLCRGNFTVDVYRPYPLNPMTRSTCPRDLRIYRRTVPLRGAGGERGDRYVSFPPRRVRGLGPLTREVYGPLDGIVSQLSWGDVD